MIVESGKRKQYGLIGKRLDYSFSKNYFTRKFEKALINASYLNLEMHDLNSLKKTLEENDISGFNVTIPFKEKIIALLDTFSETAQEVGAVNCVEITADKKWIGHNTDVIGFEKSLLNLIKKEHPRALVFGTGGASQAVQFILKKLKIDFQLVSRNDYLGYIQYENLNKEILSNHKLLINATPLGTFPNIEECADIPYEYITNKHFCLDLVYNPEKTKFLTIAQDRGAKIRNGKEMLKIQAEESWNIWTNSMNY